MSERKQFTRIQGPFSRTVYLPRAGKVRLGLKVQSAKDPTKTYPKNVDYFVVPPEVAKIFGDRPTELRVQMPCENLDVAFPQRLELYRASGLYCHGDGVEAQRFDDSTKQWVDRECPCDFLRSEKNPTGDCSPRAHLLVIIPEVKMASVYQIDTGSMLGVIAINSALETIRGLVGRVSRIPMVLRRVVRDVQRAGRTERKAILDLSLDPTYDNPEGINLLQEQTRKILEARVLVKIEGPTNDPPTAGPVDLVEDEAPAATEHVVDVDVVEDPPPPAESVKLTMNPDGAERERQAKLADPPPPASPPPDDWDAWLRDAKAQPVLFDQTCKDLHVPPGKSINRALQNRFRKRFETLKGTAA